MLALLGVSVDQAQEPAPAPEDERARTRRDGLRRRDRPRSALDREVASPLSRWLLDWGGLRTTLEEDGISTELLYTVDGSWGTGAVEDDLRTARSLLDLTFTYERPWGSRSLAGTLHAGLQWMDGGDPTPDFGVLQPLSGIDSEERFQLGRFWYEFDFAEVGTRVRLGKIDGNSQFAAVDAAAEFLHSSMGFSPTIFLMPSYPDTAFGLVVEQDAGPCTLRAGVFDGALARGVRTGDSGPDTLFDGADQWFWIGEVDVGWSGGRAAAGAWWHTAEVDRFDGGLERGTEGLYGLAEQRLWDAGTPAAPGGRLDAFLQLGSADGAVTPFEGHLGAGVQWRAPFDDSGERLGLGLSRVDLTNAPGAGLTEASETALELYWGFDAAGHMRLKADAQFVADPGGDADRDDLWVLTLRLGLSL